MDGRRQYDHAFRVLAPGLVPRGSSREGDEDDDPRHRSGEIDVQHELRQLRQVLSKTGSRPPPRLAQSFRNETPHAEPSSLRQTPLRSPTPPVFGELGAIFSDYSSAPHEAPTSTVQWQPMWNDASGNRMNVADFGASMRPPASAHRRHQQEVGAEDDFGGHMTFSKMAEELDLVAQAKRQAADAIEEAHALADARVEKMRRETELARRANEADREQAAALIAEVESRVAMQKDEVEVLEDLRLVQFTKEMEQCRADAQKQVEMATQQAAQAAAALHEAQREAKEARDDADAMIQQVSRDSASASARADHQSAAQAKCQTRLHERWRCRQLTTVLRTWDSYARGCAMLALRLQSLSQRRALQLSTSVLATWRCQHLVRKHINCGRAQITRALCTSRAHRLTSGSLVKWASLLVPRRAKQAALRKVDRIIAQKEASAVRCCWEKWHRHQAGRFVNRRKLEAAAGRRSAIVLKMVLRGMAAETAGRARSNRLLRRAFQCQQHKVTARSFHRWRQQIFDARLARSAISRLQRRRLHRVWQQLRNAVVQRKLIGAWESEAESQRTSVMDIEADLGRQLARNERLVQVVVERAFADCKSRCMSRCFGEWSGAYRGQVGLAVKLGRARLAMRQRLMAIVVAKWHRGCIMARCSHANQIRASRAAARAASRTVVRSYHRWARLATRSAASLPVCQSKQFPQHFRDPRLTAVFRGCTGRSSDD